MREKEKGWPGGRCLVGPVTSTNKSGPVPSFYLTGSLLGMGHYYFDYRGTTASSTCTLVD